MSVNLSKQLHELRKSTDDLNALTDKANDVVQRTERYLREDCRVGGPVYVDVPSLASEDPEGPSWSSLLGYDRYKGELRIVVQHLLEDEPRELKAWAECSRDIKLKSLDALPELIGELLKKVRQQVSDIQAKIDQLDGTIPASSDSPPRPPSSRKG